MEELKGRFFEETNSKKKSQLKEDIDHLIREITHNDEHFDFKVYFSEVFHPSNNSPFGKGGEGGFDIVIANPPYVSVKQISSEEKRIFSDVFSSGKGRFNLFTLFLEKGLKLLRNSGIITYILPEGIYSHVEYRYIREYILLNSTLLYVNLFSNRVFEAAVDTTVISLLNKKYTKGTFSVLRDLDTKILELSQDIFQNLPDFLITVNLTSESQPIIYKLLDNKFDRIEKILEIQQGIIYSGQPKNKVFANEEENKSYKKVIDGRDILKWKINWDLKKENKYICYTDKLHRPREERLFLSSEKIFLPRKSFRILWALDVEQFYALNTAYVCLLKNNFYSLKYILACLNSRLINYYYAHLFFGWQITIPALNSIPIKKISSSDQKPFILFVDQIFSLTKDSDYLENPAKQAKVKEYERQIDEMVYKLYGLTPEEIAIIEGGKK